MCAVEGNEEAAGIVLGGLDCKNDDGIDNCRDGPNPRSIKSMVSKLKKISMLTSIASPVFLSFVARAPKPIITMMVMTP